MNKIIGIQLRTTLPLRDLYSYYCEFTSYPQRYARHCRDVKIISKKSEKDLDVITAREVWVLDDKLSGTTQPIEIAITVRYDVRPARAEKKRHPEWSDTPPIAFTIVEGNPGDVSPDGGHVYFTKHVAEPGIIHVHVDIAGELALSHYLYHRYKEEYQKRAMIEEEDFNDYLYEQDIAILEGEEKRLDRPRVYRANIRNTGLDEFFVARVTEKYPPRNPEDRYSIRLISRGRGLHNYIELDKKQVRQILKQVEEGLVDLQAGKANKRNEMHRTNSFVWLGYDDQTKNAGHAAYLVMYFGSGHHNILIEFSSLDEVRNLLKTMRGAYDAW